MPKTVKTPLAVEHVPMRSDRDCGPAAARSVLRYFGRPAVKVDSILTPQGTPPERLAGLFVRAGLTVEMRAMTLRDLAKFTEAGSPVLCPVQKDRCGHWLVVRGVSRSRVFLTDPERVGGGLVEAPRAAFDARWVDWAADDGCRLVRFGMAISDGP